ERIVAARQHEWKLTPEPRHRFDGTGVALSVAEGGVTPAGRRRADGFARNRSGGTWRGGRVVRRRERTERTIQPRSDVRSRGAVRGRASRGRHGPGARGDARVPRSRRLSAV